MGLLFLVMLLSATSDSEFNRTVAAQKEAGFRWYNLPECRQVTPDVPAITIDSVQGQKVCYKLALTRDGAK
jgi:hypothetical protein